MQGDNAGLPHQQFLSAHEERIPDRLRRHAMIQQLNDQAATIFVATAA
jgi:hypothetical protein